MAKRLDKMPKRTRDKHLDLSKYPWTEWCDGTPWEIERGVDFTCTMTSMTVTLHRFAEAQGLIVQTSVMSKTHLAFQFYGPPRDWRPKE